VVKFTAIKGDFAAKNHQNAFEMLEELKTLPKIPLLAQEEETQDVPTITHLFNAFGVSILGTFDGLTLGTFYTSTLKM